MNLVSTYTFQLPSFSYAMKYNTTWQTGSPIISDFQSEPVRVGCFVTTGEMDSGYKVGIH